MKKISADELKNVERSILAVLQDAHPNMIGARKLWAEVNIEHPSAVAQETFDRAIESLKNKAGGPQILGIDHDDAGIKWKITPQGIARLQGA